MPFFAAVPRLSSRRPLIRRRRVRLWVEPLEARTLLSGAGLDLSTLFANAATHLAPLDGPGAGGYTPSQIRHAYGFDQITFANGTIAGDGSGQTIAIVNAYDHPNIVSDLHNFDATFGLPDPSFTKVVQLVGGRAPRVSAGWSLETALDVEWAHAIAPGANILLVEANTSSLSNLLAAVDYARAQPGVAAVSMSWGGGEFFGESSLDSHFTTPAGHSGVVFVAASGDDGGTGGAEWPSVSPNVLAVGGTSLNVSDASGTYQGESGWSGSTGGISALVSEPAYQLGAQSTGARTTPDVAFNADPNTGYAVYSSVPYFGIQGWFQVGGTSAGAPQWVGLVAIADQGRVLAGGAALDGAKDLLPALYNLPNDFNDVTTGSNAVASAGPGYDLVTGLGSPVANQLVADLAATSGSAALPSPGQGSAALTAQVTQKQPSAPAAPSKPTAPTAPSKPTQTKAPAATMSSSDTVNSLTSEAVLAISLLAGNTSQAPVSLPRTVIQPTGQAGQSAAVFLGVPGQPTLTVAGQHPIAAAETTEFLAVSPALDSSGGGVVPAADVLPETPPMQIPAKPADVPVVPDRSKPDERRDQPDSPMQTCDFCFTDGSTVALLGGPTSAALPVEEGESSTPAEPAIMAAALALVLGEYWGRRPRDVETQRRRSLPA
jgi:hypothetical protein